MTAQVDIVGNAWFFRREWLGMFWSELPDLEQSPGCRGRLHFSYMLQKFGINTYVPPHKKNQLQDWSCCDVEFGKVMNRTGPAICMSEWSRADVQAGLKKYVDKGDSDCLTRRDHR
ncbi:MAG: hypothetical protein R3C03_24165 [Pirellulaceae bacterium]